MSIENAINQILKTGTRIVSFDYAGKSRNVLIGDSRALNTPVWGRAESRAIRVHNGQKYLVGIDNNDGHIFKTFKLDEIQNPSFA